MALIKTLAYALILWAIFFSVLLLWKIKPYVKESIRIKLNNEYDCKNQVRVGDVSLVEQREYPNESYKNETHGRVDSLWFVCMDEGVGPIQPFSPLRMVFLNRSIKEKLAFISNCLVLSYGISDCKQCATFDEMMNRVYGCEVHSLDPFLLPVEVENQIGHGVSVEFKPKWYFHKLGYGQSKFTGHAPAPKSTLTLPAFLRYAGLQFRTIDVLKMDIEGAELNFLEEQDIDYLCLHVKQFVFETHNGHSYPAKSRALTERYFKALVRLQKCFQVFHRETRFFELQDEYSEFQVANYKLNLDRFHSGNELAMYVLTFGEIYMINKNFIFYWEIA
ncbi:hypothetical protein ACOME3_005018 [Neoechinorhynchus agilis]